MKIVTSKKNQLFGIASVPGDKSMSHRALMLGSIASGRSHIRNFLAGRDCEATLRVMQALGANITRLSATELFIDGNGWQGLKEPSDVLDCANSGTTMRLLAGLLSGQPFVSILSGSDVIRRRPMGRVIAPLRSMGAQIFGRHDNQLAPLVILPAASGLSSQTHTPTLASAQVKSALLLAGLYADKGDGETIVYEAIKTRDHTENMLASMGADISYKPAGGCICVRALTQSLSPLTIDIPGDISSAAFLILAATLCEGSEITITGVGVNQTRTGFLDALNSMGANISLHNIRHRHNEPVADIHVKASQLKAATFDGAHIQTARMIDELPLLVLAATQSAGITRISNAAELTVKESNRIESTAGELRALGARIETSGDGFVVEGPTPLTGTFTKSHGDHRLAMMLTIAGLVADGITEVDGAEVIDDSFCGFTETLSALGARVENK
jgi:3-phosphoshikimate 1-carboxyvinyltransferase